MEKPLGLRKGAWTEEEDELLRKCFEKYGEGEWHQVPKTAGLNRCRKSCRLRWLNYLKPNIKRGEFTNDEVDLIIRLHNLLGNRWSLIAGRLPGRTANAVKNYWNTHQRRKMASITEKYTYYSMAIRKEIIRPQPCVFPENINRIKEKALAHNHVQSEEQSSKQHKVNLPPENGEAKWWESLLNEQEDSVSSCFMNSALEG